MNATNGNTRDLFENLQKLYKQGNLLLLDADKLLGEEGWAPMHNNGIAELSYSMNSPYKWYARYAMRFYAPSGLDEGEENIDTIIFVSIHFVSDDKSSMPTDIDDPLVCAGRLLYYKPMTYKEAQQSYDYWMCKYWFIAKPQDTLEGWRITSKSRWVENLKGSESFTVPLYEITSSQLLKETVIDPLISK